MARPMVRNIGQDQTPGAAVVSGFGVHAGQPFTYDHTAAARAILEYNRRNYAQGLAAGQVPSGWPAEWILPPGSPTY